MGISDLVDGREPEDQKCENKDECRGQRIEGKPWQRGAPAFKHVTDYSPINESSSQGPREDHAEQRPYNESQRSSRDNQKQRDVPGMAVLLLIRIAGNKAIKPQVPAD